MGGLAEVVVVDMVPVTLEKVPVLMSEKREVENVLLDVNIRYMDRAEKSHTCATFLVCCFCVIQATFL